MNDRKSDARPLGAVVVGLAAAGIVALILASWILSDDLADIGPGRGWIQAFTIVIVVGVVLVGVLRRSTSGAANWALVALAAVAAGITIWAIIGFLSQYDAGFPGLCTLLAAIGGAAVAVAALLALRVPADGWWPPSIRNGLWTTGAVLLVAAVATPMMLTAPDWPLTATTGTTGKPAAVPDKVARIAWSTDVDGPIKDVAAGGMGAVVMLSDGVVGVDGATGDVRWSRRRAGADAEQIDVSPDGQTVLVQMSPNDRFPIRREALNALTGEVRFTDDSANAVHSPGFVVPMTNVSYIGANADETEFRGNSLKDGRRLWTFRAPAGCRIIGDHSEQFAVANGMLLPLACGDKEFRYISVDAATGKIRWQHVVPLANHSSRIDFDIDGGTDHTLARLYVQDAAQSQYAVFDTATGAALSSPTQLDLKARGLGVAGAPGKGVLIDVRSGRVLARKGNVLNCALDAGPALLSDGALCVNLSGKPFDGFMTTGKVELTIAGFADRTVKPISVKLGGPFAERDSSGRLFQSKAIPGAIVVYSEFQPTDGNRSRIVGLR